MPFWKRNKQEDEPVLGEVSVDFIGDDKFKLLPEKKKNVWDEIIEKNNSGNLKLTDGVVIDFEEKDQICYSIDFDDEQWMQFVVDKYNAITFNIGNSGKTLTFGISKGNDSFQIYDGNLKNSKFVKAMIDELLLHYFNENESLYRMNDLGEFTGIAGLEL